MVVEGLLGSPRRGCTCGHGELLGPGSGYPVGPPTRQAHTCWTSARIRALTQTEAFRSWPQPRTLGAWSGFLRGGAFLTWVFLPPAPAPAALLPPALTLDPWVGRADSCPASGHPRGTGAPLQVRTPAGRGASGRMQRCRGKPGRSRVWAEGEAGECGVAGRGEPSGGSPEPRAGPKLPGSLSGGPWVAQLGGVWTSLFSTCPWLRKKSKEKAWILLFFLMNSACFCLVYFLDFRERSRLKSILYLFGCAGSPLLHAGSSSRNQRPPAWAAWKDPPRYLCSCIHYFSHAEGQIGLSGSLWDPKRCVPWGRMDEELQTCLLGSSGHHCCSSGF